MRQYPNPIIDGKKICPHCGEAKLLDEFRLYKSGKKAGHYSSYCKICQSKWSVEWKLRTGRTKARKNTHLVIDGMKFCPNCGQSKPIADYYIRHGDREGELYDICKACKNRRVTECGHKSGRWRSMADAKDSAQYLGIHVAERVLSGFFDHITRMPLNNPGFDFVCGKGFKIDVKSSCLRLSSGAPSFWGFNIRQNVDADYFLCLAFNDRESLEPQHVWFFPGEVINQQSGLRISNNSHSIAKWSKYERPLDRILSCCETLRAESTRQDSA
jgi:ribosomal protein S27AE